MRPPTDTELMLAVQAGDLGKLGELFEKHHVRIFRFCLRLTGRAEVAEDLTQEAFLRALRYRRSFKESAEFLPWLYRVARNVCNDHFRRSRNSELNVEELPEVESPETSAVEILERDEDRERMRQALARLPEGRREVLVLSRFEHRKYEEIAAILDCSVGAVKIRVHRALRQLRDVYRTLAASEEGSELGGASRAGMEAG